MQTPYANAPRGAAIVVGAAEGWNVTASLRDAPDGARRRVGPDDDDTVVWVRSGQGAARRFVEGRPGCGIDASPESFAVLHHGVPQTFVAEGDLRLGRLAPKPGFLRAVAADVFGVERVAAADASAEVCTRDGAFRQMADAYLTRAFEADDPPLGVEMDARALVMAIHLMRRKGVKRAPGSGSLPAPRPAKGGLTPPARRRVEAYVEDHLAEAIRLADLAAEARLSPFHFNRAFKHSLGLTPVGYIQERRVERAKALLKPSGPPIIEVASAVGYQDPAHFAGLFRRHTGVSPSRFRAGE